MLNIPLYGAEMAIFLGICRNFSVVSFFLIVAISGAFYPSSRKTYVKQSASTWLDNRS